MSENVANKKIWVIERDTSKLSELRDKLQSLMIEFNFPEDKRMKMTLCADEAAANIVEHVCMPCQNKMVQNFRVEVFIQDEIFTVVFIDCGQPYDPTKQKEVNLQEHIRSGKKGGLGLYIMKSQLDRFEYEYRDNCNVLTIGMKIS